MENLLNGYFYYKFFFEPMFFRTPILVADKKINKTYQRKIKSGDRLWALEITIGNNVFMENYFA